MRRLVVLVCIGAAACPVPLPLDDAGPADAAALDAGALGDGGDDGGAGDGGSRDAGTDAGADAGHEDAGAGDAGAPDGGCGSVGPDVACPACDGTAGDVVLLGSFQSPSAPEAPLVRDDGARLLLFSDSPEAPASSGLVLAAAVPAGPARVVLYHVNGAAVPKKASVVVENAGDAALTAHLERFAVPPPSTQYVAQGQAAVRSFLDADNAADKSVPAHGAALLLVDHLDDVAVAPGELIHALVDVTFSAPATVRVVVLDHGADTLASWPSLTALPRDVHDRGTFDGGDRTLRSAGCPWPAGTQRVRVGADTALLPDPRGTDELTGSAERLAGHYGSLVRLELPPSAAPRALVVVPRAGAYAGAARVTIDGGGSAVVAMPLLSVNDRGVLLGRLPADQGGVVELIPAGGSNLPVDVLAIPLP